MIELLAFMAGFIVGASVMALQIMFQYRDDDDED